jgi:hypothetical protein
MRLHSEKNHLQPARHGRLDRRLMPRHRPPLAATCSRALVLQRTCKSARTHISARARAQTHTHTSNLSRVLSRLLTLLRACARVFVCRRMRMGACVDGQVRASCPVKSAQERGVLSHQ